MLAGIDCTGAAIATGAGATVVTGAVATVRAGVATILAGVATILAGVATVVTGTAGANLTGAAGGIAIGSVIERIDGVVVCAAATSVWIVLGALNARGGRSLNDNDLAFAGFEGDAGPATTDNSPTETFCGKAVARFCGKAIIALRRANSSAARLARRRARYRRHQARDR